ncbi:MAG: hypothetical protein H6923_08440 [Alphaproteobacteria bacterium]|nr:hypothetical protein [Alphaproteobacteria bacterium]
MTTHVQRFFSGLFGQFWATWRSTVATILTYFFIVYMLSGHFLFSASDAMEWTDKIHEGMEAVAQWISDTFSINVDIKGAFRMLVTDQTVFVSTMTLLVRAVVVGGVIAVFKTFAGSGEK